MHSHENHRPHQIHRIVASAAGSLLALSAWCALGCGPSQDPVSRPSPSVEPAHDPPPAPPPSVPPAEGEPTDVEHHAGALYAVDGSTVVRAELTAVSTPRTLVDLGGRLRVARIAVSDAGVAILGQPLENGQLVRRSAIWVAAHDGSGLRELWSADGDAYDVGLHASEVVWTFMALDPRTGALDESSGVVLRAPFTGGAPRTLARVDHPRELVVHASDAFVSSRAGVVQLSLTSESPARTWPVPSRIGALAVDARSIATADLVDGAIHLVDRATGSARARVSSGFCARDLELDEHHVWFACGNLYRVSRSSGAVETRTSQATMGSLNGLSVVGDRAYGYSALEHRFVSIAR